MNSIIALCHFCEVHGPCVLFCTQTLRDTKLDELNVNEDNLNNKNCLACNSIGNKIGMLSKDDESNANFLSTQYPVISDVHILLKQAAVRSLSCEVSFNKNGGFVFFGDATRGHVLSHTFQLRDSQARGFYRLFSIIILMKDKMFLLNVQPFLSDHLENISKELQNYSNSVYTIEQTNCSERAERINTGHANTQAPRSIIDLTGEEHIFAILHSHFSWLLWSGARYLTETVTLGSPSVPPWVEKETEEGFAMVQVDKEDWLMRKVGMHVKDDIDTTNSFRYYKETLRSDFISLCYCALVGIQIILRGPQNITSKLAKCLRKLLPEPLHNLVVINSRKCLTPAEGRILSVPPEVAVPKPTATVFRIDFIGNNNISIKWCGQLPNKLPDLLVKVMKAIDEPLLTDNVLEKHLRVLIEEWKNKILCIKKVSPSSESKIKRVLGVQPHDQVLYRITSCDVIPTVSHEVMKTTNWYSLSRIM